MQASATYFSNKCRPIIPRVHTSTSLKSSPPSTTSSPNKPKNTTLSLRHHHTAVMAEHRQQEQGLQQRATDALKGSLPEKGPSKSQILAVVTLLPLGGLLLLISGLTLTGTLIGLAVATPLFVIFSPILVPAVLTVALAIAGFLTSGAFGITALSSFSWMISQIRRTFRPEQMEHAKRRVQDTAGQMGQKAREVGHKTQESGRT
ncbi:hypothetical protein U1Q18_027359 [Sarracenia purpurea var. burkii]